MMSLQKFKTMVPPRATTSPTRRGAGAVLRKLALASAMMGVGGGVCSDQL